MQRFAASSMAGSIFGKIRAVLGVYALALALAACGGGGGGGSSATSTAATSAQTGCPAAPTPTLSGVQNGTIEVFLGNREPNRYFMPDYTTSGFILMVDDGGPTATFDVCGTAKVSGLAPGKHDIYVFSPAVNGASSLYAIMQTDQAHIEVDYSEMMNTHSVSQYATIKLTGKILNAPTGGNLVFTFTDATGSTTETIMGINNQSNSVTVTPGTGGGPDTYTAWIGYVPVNGRKPTVTGHLVAHYEVPGSGYYDAIDFGTVTLNTSAIFTIGPSTIVDNPLDLNFAANGTKMATYSGTINPPAGMTPIQGYLVSRSWDDIASESLVASAGLPGGNQPNTVSYTRAALANENLYLNAVGGSTGFFPGTRWSLSMAMSPNTPFTDNSSFTTLAGTTSPQRGATFTFTPGTGAITAYVMKTRGLTVIMPPTNAGSFTMPVNIPAGAGTPFAAWNPLVAEKFWFREINYGNMSYGQYVSGAPSILQRIEVYEEGGYYYSQ